ncbi:unnamed protein product [Enterobius vermicularis]|uniref:Mitofilin n=1 Tax=Enterobius vermicularis TaxID=51028 RepID=A0A0N4UW73_ENTVE|nr:unnamed protein product [Enterobius vermicularis]
MNWIAVTLRYAGGPRLRFTRTPSGSDKFGVSRKISFRTTNYSSSMNELLFSIETLQDVIRSIEKTLSAFELVRNNSEKDKGKAELLSSVIDRLKVVETDLNRVSAEEGFDKLSSVPLDVSSVRSGALSVLSDDTFMSALDEFQTNLDDADVLMREPINLEKDALAFYREGMSAALAGSVVTRKCRLDFCQCEDELDFRAKVWCLRKGFSNILSNEHNRLWLTQSARKFFADLLRHAKKDPVPFFKAYDEMTNFLNDSNNLELVETELKQRKVAELGFWDVVLDFILIDSFEDLARPPSAVLAVTRNMFLSQSMKESTLSTLIWSMLQAKRARLPIRNGFISHFYDISEVVSPTITLGFLGTDEHMRELCDYFKEQMCSFIVDVFNINRVRYTSLTDLAEDTWLILQARVEMIQTRINTELLPS